MLKTDWLLLWGITEELFRFRLNIDDIKSSINTNDSDNILRSEVVEQLLKYIPTKGNFFLFFTLFFQKTSKIDDTLPEFRLGTWLGKTDGANSLTLVQVIVVLR